VLITETVFEDMEHDGYRDWLRAKSGRCPPARRSGTGHDAVRKIELKAEQQRHPRRRSRRRRAPPFA
jgi:hypothetical protein